MSDIEYTEAMKRLEKKIDKKESIIKDLKARLEQETEWLESSEETNSVLIKENYCLKQALRQIEYALKSSEDENNALAKEKDWLEQILWDLGYDLDELEEKFPQD